MPSETTMNAHADMLAASIADEYLSLAGLLEACGPEVWDAPSLCAGWRTREVVAHVTMPARYDGPAFMAELEAARGDFTLLSNTVASRDATLPTERLVADLRSPVLHGWQPPGGGWEGALTHCVIHGLDIVESIPLPHRIADQRIAIVLSLVANPATPNLFGTDLDGVELRADDLEWSSGTGASVIGSAQALALVACGRLLPAGRVRGQAAGRFTRT